MAANILDQLALVVCARRDAAQALKARKDAYLAFQESNASLLEREKETEAIKIEAEEKLRAMAIELYTETGSKTLAPGVSIRVITALSFSQVETFAWAVEHKRALKFEYVDVNVDSKTGLLDISGGISMAIYPYAAGHVLISNQKGG